MLAAHLTALAALRALFNEGKRMEISNAMMPMTTKSSTSVKPPRGLDRSVFINKPLVQDSNAILLTVFIYVNGRRAPYIPFLSVEVGRRRRQEDYDPLPAARNR